MNVSLTEQDVKNALVCIRVTWEAGYVKGEQQGAALAELRGKLEAALKQDAASPRPLEKVV